MNAHPYRKTFTNSLTAALLLMLLLLTSYFAFEPSIMIAAATDSDVFTVQQTIVGELAFVTNGADVTMSPNISGITGGTSNGSTVVAVRANNSTGYNMTIHFASTTAMIGNTSGYISNYTPASTTVPDYTFTTPTNGAEFGYTVEATTLGDEVQMFRDNGSTCNTGPANSSSSCWYNVANASNTVMIINRTSATLATGATTTIRFRVGVDANPSPTLPSGVYTATATLTATEN